MQRFELVTEDEVRAASVALARYATNGAAGWWEGDVLFREVTEGRQSSWYVNGKRRDYSGCGDLPMWVFWRLLGLDRYDSSPAAQKLLRQFMNRREAFGWKVGWNIVKLQLAGKAWRRFKKGEFNPGVGDALLIGEHGAEHVMIYEDRNGDEFTSFDYGQFDAKRGKHGGKACRRKFLRQSDGRVWVGNSSYRPAIGVVDVWTLFEMMRDAAGGLTDALVPDEFAA